MNPRNILLLVTAGVAALATAELLSRAISPTDFMKPPERRADQEILYRHSEVPGLVYELAPNRVKINQRGVTVAINSYGMRDDEPLDASEGPLCTVAVLGDSFTFGAALDASATYPAILEKSLSPGKPDVRIQVLNFGVSGYSTRDEVAVLRHKVFRWNPQLIVIGFVLNDSETDYPFGLPLYFRQHEWWQEFNVLRLAAKAFRDVQIRIQGQGDVYRYWNAVGARHWRTVPDGFAQIRQMASQHDVPVLLVIFPLIQVSEWAEYPYLDIHARVADVARENGFHVVDLSKAYRSSRPSALVVAALDSHPSALAARLAAEAIKAEITARDLLDCGSR